MVPVNMGPSTGDPCAEIGKKVGTEGTHVPKFSPVGICDGESRRNCERG